jgi:hypothetical protein
MSHGEIRVATKLKCPSFRKVEMSHLAEFEHGWAGRRLHISQPGPAMRALLFCSCLRSFRLFLFGSNGQL